VALNFVFCRFAFLPLDAHILQSQRLVIFPSKLARFLKLTTLVSPSTASPQSHSSIFRAPSPPSPHHTIITTVLLVTPSPLSSAPYPLLNPITTPQFTQSSPLPVARFHSQHHPVCCPKVYTANTRYSDFILQGKREYKTYS